MTPSPPPDSSGNRNRHIAIVLAGTLMATLLAVGTSAEPLDVGDKDGGGKRMRTYAAPPQTDAAAEWDKVYPEQLLAVLPADLPPEKRELSRLAIFEVTPRLRELSNTFINVYDELRELSFNSNTPPETLAKLGQKLSHSRKALRKELHKLNKRLEHITGYNLKLDDPGQPNTPMAKRLRAACPPKGVPGK